MISVTIDTRSVRIALSELEDNLVDAAYRALKAAQEEAVRDAKSTTLFKDGPDRKGRKGPHLRESIEAGRPQVSTSSIGSHVAASAKHASYVENGTPQHVITARGGGMLRFVVNGATIYKRSVNHPGTKPRPFMAHAEAVGQVVLENELDELTRRACDRFNAA